MPFKIPNSERWISPDGDIIQSRSKRRESRQRVLLCADIHVMQMQSDFMVTDIARNGLRGATSVPLRIGQSAYVSLEGRTYIAGRIRWAKDGRFGMTFSKLDNMLPDAAHGGAGHVPSYQKSFPQAPNRVSARLCLTSWSSAVRIRNVSKTGMMIETDLPVTSEQQLLVALSDGKILDAAVKWVEGEYVGIQLAAPVSILQLTYGDLR